MEQNNDFEVLEERELKNCTLKWGRSKSKTYKDTDTKVVYYQVTWKADSSLESGIVCPNAIQKLKTSNSLFTGKFKFKDTITQARFLYEKSLNFEEEREL